MNRKPGDWNCRSCQHLNFGRRDTCQRCGDPRSMISDRSYFGGGSFVGGGGGGGTRGGSGSSFGFTGSDVRPGDWYCQCGTHNFASRLNCFKCNAFKDDSSVPASAGLSLFDGDVVARQRAFGFSGVAASSGWKSGDWICNRSGCNEHNFASRMECFRCNAPRDSGTEV